MQNRKNLTLFLIRHGETRWNRELRFQGHEDSPLTSKGRRQARALVQRVEGLGLDELHASDLGRAQETAGIIAASSGHRILLDARLRERNYGVLEGLTKDDIDHRFPEVLNLLRGNNPDYIIPKGESLRQHYHRNIDFIEEIAACKNGKKIAIVVHGGVLDSCFRYVCGLRLDQPRCVITTNAELAEIELGSFFGSRRWVIKTWGERTHLEGI